MNRMADASGELIRSQWLAGFETEIKGDGSPVTSVDQAAERYIREIITELHPDHGIIGEEFDDTSFDSEFVWVIDPIDGTLAFLAGFPVFGTLIALLQNKQPILGTIDMPLTKERWIGGEGRQTSHNGNPVKVRSCADISQAMMSTSNLDYFDAQTEPALRAMNRMSPTRIRMR